MRSLAPLLALRRLAIQQGDAALLLRAREGLSERELGAGEPGWATLELAEHYDLVADKPELAESRYRAALGGASVALGAAAYAVPGGAVLEAPFAPACRELRGARFS